MKHISYITLLVLIFCTSCGKDYLQTESTSGATNSTIFESTKNAAVAVRGISLLMSYEYKYTTAAGAKSAVWNGEGAIMMNYGDYMGNNTVVANKNAYGTLYKGTNYMVNVTSVYDYYPWSYYYKLIANANAIINNIDEASGSQDERDYIKAQGLTYRAYCYYMLSQLYCNRWSDANSAESRGVVLRLGNNNGDLAACTLGQLYTQIYTDIQNAIKLFEGSKESRESSDYYTPNLNVAQAIYARIALTKGDNEIAADMASKARQGYSLMSETEYKSGFSAPNKEWIWGCYSSESQSIGQYSIFAQLGYNRSFYLDKPTLISRELYNKIPETDIRRSIFLNGDGYTYTTTGNKLGLAGTALANHARELFPDLTGDVYAYMQFKFRCADDAGKGQGCLNLIRASEMYLIEAEAQAKLKHDDLARKCLTELIQDSGRDESFSTSATGDALMEQIKLYRAIELWGEGFDWFDMKRWGDTIDRKGYAAGGNFYGSLIFTIAPTDNNDWRWVFPKLETDYNSLVSAW